MNDFTILRSEFQHQGSTPRRSALDGPPSLAESGSPLEKFGSKGRRQAMNFGGRNPGKARDSGKTRSMRRGFQLFPVFAALTMIPLIGFSIGSIWDDWFSWGTGSAIDERAILHEVKRESLNVSVIERGSLESQTNLQIICEVDDVQRDGINGTPIVWIIPNGSSVEKGDLLVEIDSTPMREELDEQVLDTEEARSSQIQADANYQNQLVQNETQEAEAKLKVQLAKLELEMFTDEENGTHRLAVEEIKRSIDDVNNQILEAQATLELRKEDRRGVESLFKLGYANRNELRKSELAYLQAEGQYAAQLNRLETTLATLRKAQNYEKEMQLLTLQGKLETAERGLEQALRNNEAKLAQVKAIRIARTESLLKEEERLKRYRNQLEACKIYAPEGGMVAYASDRNDEIREGVPVRFRQHLLSIPSLERMQVQTVIHESDLDQVDLGMPAKITVDAFPEIQYEGSVKSIAVLPDQNGWLGSDTKVYPTTVTIDTQVEKLKPGMTAVTEILIDSVEDAVVVPIQAVVEREKQTWVVLRDGERLVPRKITTGRSNDSRVEIVDGVREKQEVVLNPRDFIDDLLSAQVQ